MFWKALGEAKSYPSLKDTFDLKLEWFDIDLFLSPEILNKKGAFEMVDDFDINEAVKQVYQDIAEETPFWWAFYPGDHPLYYAAGVEEESAYWSEVDWLGYEVTGEYSEQW